MTLRDLLREYAAELPEAVLAGDVLSVTTDSAKTRLGFLLSYSALPEYVEEKTGGRGEAPSAGFLSATCP